MIDHVDRATWLDSWQGSPPPETLIFFEHSFEWGSHVVPLLRSGLYRCIYAVPGTRITLVTLNPISGDLPRPSPMLAIGGQLGPDCQ